MTRIEPYRPPRPTIRELMEGRPGGGGTMGESLRRGIWGGRPSRPTGRRTGRESARDTTMARGRPADSTRSRRTTASGQVGDRREGRVESREMSETRGRGAHLEWPGTAKGQAPGGRWDRTRTPRGAVTDGLCRVVRACRGEGTTRQEARRGRRGQKETRTKPRSDTGGREAQSEGAAGQRDGANGQTRDPGWRGKKKKKNNDG